MNGNSMPSAASDDSRELGVAHNGSVGDAPPGNSPPPNPSASWAYLPPRRRESKPGFSSICCSLPVDTTTPDISCTGEGAPMGSCRSDSALSGKL
eukprot:scaffold528_cov126-Isochrysis_galbana.AAC.6